MKETRNYMLKLVGEDTSGFFSPEIDAEPSQLSVKEIEDQIYANGYVKNSKLHRRWITAHYLRLIKYANHRCSGNWNSAVNAFYPYMYQFRMMRDECYTLSVLERKDREAYDERRQFFTLDVIRKVISQYCSEVEKYVESRQIRHCGGREYKRISGTGNVFVDNIERDVMKKIGRIKNAANRATTYREMNTAFAVMKHGNVKLKRNTAKSDDWLNAFQSEGAYYTLMNLIRFHECRLPEIGSETVREGENAVEYLKSLVGTYTGKQWHELVLKTIAHNDFDLAESIEAHKS